MKQKSEIEKFVNGVAALYLLGGLAVAAAILYGLVVGAAQLVPGTTWVIVSIFFSINVGVVVFRSLVAGELTGHKGLIFTAGALVILLMQVGTVAQMGDMGRAGLSGIHNSRGTINIGSLAQDLLLTVAPCLFAVIGLVRSCIEQSSAERKRLEAERRRWPH